MWTTPAGARPSGSSMTIAKLFVPSGAPDQASGGETFSPTQFGLRCLSAQAFLTTNWSLSLSADEVSSSTSALAAEMQSMAAASAANAVAIFMAWLSSLVLRKGAAPSLVGVAPRRLAFVNVRRNVRSFENLIRARQHGLRHAYSQRLGRLQVD